MKIELLVEQEISVSPLCGFCSQKGHEFVLFNLGQVGKAPDCVRVSVGDRNNRADFEHKMQLEKFGAAIDMVCFTGEDAASSVHAFREFGVRANINDLCVWLLL